MTDLRWKLIETYQRPPYAGYDDVVLLGWDMSQDGTVMHFGVGWLGELSHKGQWVDCSDKKPWPLQPTHWLCSLRHKFQQDFRDVYDPAQRFL